MVADTSQALAQLRPSPESRTLLADARKGNTATRPWLQGEHVAIVGDTGSGKSFLEAKLIRLRDYVIVLKTKPDPDDDVKFKGYQRIHSVQEIKPTQNYYLLEPPGDKERETLNDALVLAYAERGWTICADELYYLTMLKMEKPVNRILTQGRSLGLTFVGCAQRAAWVTRFFLSQSTHCFFFASEGRDIKLLSEATTPRIVPHMSRLKRYECVYYNRIERSVQVVDANHLKKVFSNA